jgi:hypothetical protein
MITASLTLESLTISAEELTRRLGRAPDRSHVKGQAIGEGNQRPRRAHHWELALVDHTSSHFGTEGLSRAIAALGFEFADRVASLGPEVDVVIDVVQRIRDEFDYESKGILVESNAIAWMARAHALLSIDQYINID